MQKEDKHILVMSENGSMPEIIFQKKTKFKSIPYILMVDILFHRFSDKKIIKLYFSYYKQENRIKLVYLLTTKRSTLREINTVLSVMYEFGLNVQAEKIDTLIVNPFLTNRIMERNGWIFIKRKKIVGRVFIKNII
jgi:hypothetical protein